MHKFRVGLVATLATLALGATAGPAAAQEGGIQEGVEVPQITWDISKIKEIADPIRPGVTALPCVPTVNVTSIQNCAVQTALYVFAQVDPPTLINTVNTLVNNTRARAEAEARAVLAEADRIEDMTIETACYILFDDTDCNGAMPSA